MEVGLFLCEMGDQRPFTWDDHQGSPTKWGKMPMVVWGPGTLVQPQIQLVFLLVWF